MPSDLRNPRVLGAIGFSCGIGMSALGFLAAGAGHGSYVLLGLFSAPLGEFRSVVVALIGPPFLWSMVGLILGWSRTNWLCRIAFPVLLIIHYLSLFMILSPPSPFADWKYVEKVKSLVIVGFTFYLAGHCFLWILYVQQFLTGPPDEV
jgi:hypothetical protein